MYTEWPVKRRGGVCHIGFCWITAEIRRSTTGIYQSMTESRWNMAGIPRSMIQNVYYIQQILLSVK